MQSGSSSLDYKPGMVQDGLLNQEKPFLLPPDFQPSKWDITIPCGWVKSKEHSGNARFLEMCEQQLETYDKCTSKVERSNVIHRIVLSVMAGSPTHTGFVNRDKTTGRWHFIGMTRARERVGYVLRRAIADKKAKRELSKQGDTNKSDEGSKKKTKMIKNYVTKKQEQTGIAWHVAPSKLASNTESWPDKAAASAVKSLAIRRRKFPAFDLVNNKFTSTMSEEDKAEQAPSKRQKTLASAEKDVLSEALSIVMPSTSEISYQLPGASASSSSVLLPGLLGSTPAAGRSSSSTLYSSGHRDIYLEAAIREHVAWREHSAIRELAQREAMQDRLAFQEEALLRDRIKMHEDAAMRERLVLQERLNKRAESANKHHDTPIAEALAAAKAKKAGQISFAKSTLLTPSQQTAALGASPRYSSVLLGPDPLRTSLGAPKYSLLYPPIL